MINYFSKLPENYQHKIKYYQPLSDEQLTLIFSRNHKLTIYYCLSIIFGAVLALCAPILIGHYLIQMLQLSIPITFLISIILSITFIYLCYLLNTRLMRSYALNTQKLIGSTPYKVNFRCIDSYSTCRLGKSYYKEIISISKYIPELGLAVAHILRIQGFLNTNDYQQLDIPGIRYKLNSLINAEKREGLIHTIKADAFGRFDTVANSPIYKFMSPEQYYRNHSLDQVEDTIKKLNDSNDHAEISLFNTSSDACSLDDDLSQRTFVASLEYIVESHRMVEEFGGLIEAQKVIDSLIDISEQHKLKSSVQTVINISNL